MSLLGPYLIGCALLVVAGVSKLLRPQPTAVVLSGIWSSPLVRPRRLAPAVRIFSLVEVALGIAAVIYPVPLAATAVAASYVVFGSFVLHVRLKGGADAGCGCFGSESPSESPSGEPEPAPATGLHVFVDLGLAGAAAAVASANLRGTLFSILARQRLEGVPLVAACAVGAWLVVLWLVALPRLARERRIVEGIP